jgi:hypothetical protein
MEAISAATQLTSSSGLTREDRTVVGDPLRDLPRLLDTVQ